MTTKMIFFRGIQCSGKTSVALELMNKVNSIPLGAKKIVRFNRDDMRKMSLGNTLGFDRDYEDTLSDFRTDFAIAAVNNGLHYLDDNTNVKVDQLLRSIRYIESRTDLVRTKVHIVTFRPDLETSLIRNFARMGHMIPENIILKFNNQFVSDLGNISYSHITVDSKAPVIENAEYLFDVIFKKDYKP